MLKVALIADELTRACLVHECKVIDLTPLNYRLALRMQRPDFLLVESAWQGRRNAWKYKIAAYPDHPERTNRTLAAVVALARDLGIPTVFWNKEDSAHYARFIDSARLFDHVLTVDENCVSRYREAMGSSARIDVLPFPVQPAMHNFSGFQFKHYRANFVGSYGLHVHDRRRAWQDMIFGAASKTGLGLTVFDRNSDRRAAHYRFPVLDNVEIRRAVPHEATAQIYRDYLVSLNVNTVDDSPTMYSRRLVEIFACGGVAVTSPARAVDEQFGEYCYVVTEESQALELFSRLRDGPSNQDLERARAGAEFVLREHTWKRRLQTITNMLKSREPIL